MAAHMNQRQEDQGRPAAIEPILPVRGGLPQARRGPSRHQPHRQGVKAMEKENKPCQPLITMPINGDFAKTVAHARRPPPREVHRGDLSGKSAACQPRPRVRATGTYKGVRDERNGERHGHPVHRHLLQRALPAVRRGEHHRGRLAGAMRADMELGSVCAGMGACTNSDFAASIELGGTLRPICDYELLSARWRAQRNWA